MFQEGAEGSLDALLERYSDEMLKLALRLAHGDNNKAEEVVQNARIKIFNNREKVSCWAYIKQIVVNEYKDLYRQNEKKYKQGKVAIGVDISELQIPVIGEGEPLVDNVEEAYKLNDICDSVIRNAGFLNKEAKELFRKTMKGQLDKETLEKRLREIFDHIIGLDTEKCMDFLKREAKYSSSLISGSPNRFQEYRKEIERIIKSQIPKANPRLVSLLVDAHMITSAWPGWPFIKWNDIVGCSNPPRLAEGLVRDIKDLRNGMSREELIGLLEFTHYKSLIIRQKMKWPFKVPG
jgi:DNA-directed RNA polymerase specialized sigma24 family protein